MYNRDYQNRPSGGGGGTSSAAAPSSSSSGTPAIITGSTNDKEDDEKKLSASDKEKSRSQPTGLNRLERMKSLHRRLSAKAKTNK
uniref:Uncharacterized protein n=1 Tax=Panagrolaimus superbus TaxID=310955 RepID=A0A914ZG93_9BILA